MQSLPGATQSESTAVNSASRVGGGGRGEPILCQLLLEGTHSEVRVSHVSRNVLRWEMLELDDSGPFLIPQGKT